MTHWYDLTREQQSNLLLDIAFNLTVGDDNNIHLSNLSRAILEKSGIDEDKLFDTIVSIAAKWRVAE